MRVTARDVMGTRVADGVPRVLASELSVPAAQGLAASTGSLSRGGGRGRGVPPVEFWRAAEFGPGVWCTPLEPVALGAASEADRFLQEVVWDVVFEVELKKSPLRPPSVAAEYCRVVHRRRPCGAWGSEPRPHRPKKGRKDAPRSAAA